MDSSKIQCGTSLLGLKWVIVMKVMGIHIRLVWFILLDEDVEKESHCGSDEQAEECREIFKDTDMVKLIFNLLSLSIRKHFFFSEPILMSTIITLSIGTDRPLQTL